MKKAQWITIGVGVFLVFIIYRFGRTVPLKERHENKSSIAASPTTDLTDSILNQAKSQIKPDQLMRITALENSISRGAVKQQQLMVYHQLAHFWGDTAGFFPPFGWYQAQAARLENSENSLTFAARLFLENLQQEPNSELRRWEALQAKDLFERSLNINPDNDSAKVGLGACYLFGNISAMPMEGIAKIREVVSKDSTNVYAQMMLVKGSLLSGQYDKAIARLETINRIEPDNLEAILMLADTYERMNDKAQAIKWYEKSLAHAEHNKELKAEILKRIGDLKK